ncbi:MAG: hypothetical protein LQ343_007240 [Gyalolechia ehrenbergii]|nr:MAG: hypothetical protein LQ343_007240 [Gyalolechia ehrenbergii]
MDASGMELVEEQENDTNMDALTDKIVREFAILEANIILKAVGNVGEQMDQYLDSRNFGYALTERKSEQHNLRED